MGDCSDMPKKRLLSPKSIWDYEQVSEAFKRDGIKEIHLQKLYRCAMMESITNVPCTNWNSHVYIKSSTWRKDVAWMDEYVFLTFAVVW